MPEILALTVITSLRDDDLKTLGMNATVEEQVVRLARLAVDAGCHGVVSSPREAVALRQMLPNGQLLVVPGTQLPGEAPSDHARTMTPEDAIRVGATHLIVGRSITRAPNPIAAFKAFSRHLHNGMLR